MVQNLRNAHPTEHAIARIVAPVLVLMFAVFAPHHAIAIDYEVGPGKTNAAIGDVPLELLQAGDTLRIFWRPKIMSLN